MAKLQRSMYSGMAFLKIDRLRTGFALIFISLAGLAQGQAPDLWQKVKDAFPDAPAAYVSRHYELNLKVVGDSLVAYTDISEDLMHIRENTESVTRNRVYGSHFSEVSALEAATLVWEKNRYKESQVSSFKKNSDRDRGIFYDNSYYYAFDYPSVAKHNRTLLKYRQTFREPRFISGFIFGSYLPQLDASYTIRTTKGVAVNADVLNDPENRVHMTKKERGNEVTYTYAVERMSGLRKDDGAPDVRYYVPHLVVYVKAFESKSGHHKVLPDLDALYAMYWGYIDGINKDAGSQIPAIVSDLKKDCKSELDIVRKVFYWVQDNIQYIAFEEGMRGFIPHTSAYTCEKKYGDCKDMANIIVGMLEQAGVKTYHTWIGTRSLPYSYSRFPSPIVDNHMIATYITANGEYLFLDGTSKLTPLGFPSSMIQGKEALIGYGPGKYEVKVVPVVAPELSLVTDTMNIRLEGMTIAGKGSLELRGYIKIDGDSNLDQNSEDEVKKKLNTMVTKGNNKFDLKSYSIRNQADRDKPTRVAYSFEIGDYVQKAGTDLFINLNLNKDFNGAFMNKATRHSPLERDYQYTERHFTEFEIPEGFTFDELPPNSTYTGTFISHEILYELVGNKIRLTRTILLNKLMVYPADFDAWNTDVRKLTDCYKESIMLKKN